MRMLLPLAMLWLAAPVVAQPGIEPDHVIRPTPNALLRNPAHVFTSCTPAQFGAFFMKKAVLIDATGEITIGRERIVRWYEAHCKDAQTPQCCTATMENSILHQIRPDLIVVAAKTQVQNRDVLYDLSYNILWRRIDGQWYIESCSIVAADPSMAADALSFQPKMFDPAR